MDNDVRNFPPGGMQIVWKPNPGGQVKALSCPAFECLYHGSRGSGKSDVLLMDFAQHVGKGFGPEYKGLILREATTELKDIISKSLKYFPRLFPGAKFNATTKVWTFPQGESLWFHYARLPSDYAQFHGQQFCLSTESYVLFHDGTLKKAGIIKEGEYLRTLQGNRKVTKVLRYKKPATQISVSSADFGLIGTQLQGINHPLLTTDGWQRLALPCLFEISEQSLHGLLYLEEVSQFLAYVHQGIERVFYRLCRLDIFSTAVNLPILYSCLSQIFQQFCRLLVQRVSVPEFLLYALQENGPCFAFYEKFWEICGTTYKDERRGFWLLFQKSLSLLVQLRTLQKYHAHLAQSILLCQGSSERSFSRQMQRHLSSFQSQLATGFYPGPFPSQLLSALGLYSQHDIWKDVLSGIDKELSLKYRCFDGYNQDDVQSPKVLGIVQDVFPSQDGVQQQNLNVYGHSGVLCNELKRSCWVKQISYVHPYTRESCQTTAAVLPLDYSLSPFSSPVEMVDFEVEGANHYLSLLKFIRDSENSPGIFLVNQNCIVGWEEVTNHPTDEIYLMLMSCVRSAVKGMPLKYRANCNPSGPGTSWVKQRFIDAVPEGRIMVDEFGKTRAHIFLPTEENKILLEATPDYQNTLMAMTEGNENLRRAWLLGSWDVVLGGYFTDVWDPKIHILRSKEFGNPYAPAFKIPFTWQVQRSFDWGSSRPWCVTYGAISNGEQPDGIDFYIPPNSVIIIDEIYGWTGKPNEGDQATSGQIADRVKKKDRELHELHATYDPFQKELRHIHVAPGPADNSIWNVIDGSSIGNTMHRHGLYWKKSYKGAGSRKAGLAIIRDMLLAAKKKDPEAPHLYFFQSASNHIRCIPIQQRSLKDPEDIDTDLEDHCIAEGELILTDRGNIPVQDVTCSDKVLTRDGWKQVLVAGKTGEKQKIVQIQGPDGVSVKCKANHRVYTENKGFSEAGSLVKGDVLLWLKGWDSAEILLDNAVLVPVQEITDAGTADVYDLTIDQKHEFFVNGVLVANCIDSMRYLLNKKKTALKIGGVKI